MKTLGHLEDTFQSIFGRAPSEPGEFDAPDPAAVCRTRLELERIRRRNLADATPSPVFGGREGAEL